VAHRIVITSYNPTLDFGESLVKDMGVELRKGMWSTEEDLIANTADADAVIGCSPLQPWTSRVIESMARCRIIASLSIGYDRIDVGAASRLGMAVTNLPDFCVEEVSTQSLAFLLALARRLLPIDRAVREKQITITPVDREKIARYGNPVYRLSEQTLGIIGLGRIGTALAVKARGLGMRIIAYDPYVLEGVMLSHHVTSVDFDTLLRQSDYISINAALNDETRNMIDRKAFEKMKRTAYLINTARGGIVEPAALVEAIQEGKIAGAGLDTTAEEPLSPGNPLLGMPNVILTGHSAWYSTTSDSGPGYWQKGMVQVMMALQGRWPTYAVNPEIKRQWLQNWGKGR
jgi:D-3-phosphoglycerate dehydrogenase / 2-oxoglutarate reductase